MNVRNCRKCGKIYNHVMGMKMCPACKQKMDDKFMEVKEFIRKNKTATLAEVCETCDVDSNQIHQWIREERLQFSDDSPIKIACEGCGTMIGSGKFCPKCAAGLADKLGASIAKPEVAPQPVQTQKKENKMRFLQ